MPAWETEYVLFGKITKPHGLKGQLSLFIELKQPLKNKNLESVFLLQNNEPVPFFLEQIQWSSATKALLKFEGVNDLEAANSLRNAQVLLPQTAIKKVKNTALQLSDLIGFSVFHHDQNIGQVSDVLVNPNQSLFVIERNDNEVYVPAVEEFILSIDTAAQHIYLQLPEGLLELNN